MSRRSDLGVATVPQITRKHARWRPNVDIAPVGDAWASDECAARSGKRVAVLLDTALEAPGHAADGAGDCLRITPNARRGAFFQGGNAPPRALGTTRGGDKIAALYAFLDSMSCSSIQCRHDANKALAALDQHEHRRLAFDRAAQCLSHGYRWSECTQ
jgi:hypothetical protein